VLARSAGSFEEITSSIAGQLAVTSWQGLSAERFRARWNEEYDPVLRRVVQALQEAAAEVAAARERLIQI
jgi:hypothetical protein